MIRLLRRNGVIVGAEEQVTDKSGKPVLGWYEPIPIVDLDEPKETSAVNVYICEKGHTHKAPGCTEPVKSLAEELHHARHMACGFMGKGPYDLAKGI